MTRDQVTNSVLVSGIALTWVVGAALVIDGLLRAPQRLRDLGDTAIERILGTERMRLAGTIDRIEQDLREEAAFISSQDSLDTRMCIDRWLPLLSSDRPICAIDMADESGELLRFERANNMWRATRSSDPAEGGQAIISEWPISARPATADARIGDALKDPRSAAWFGQALEDKGPEPTWSMAHAGDSILLSLSVLVRASSHDRPYHILQFEFFASDLVRTITPSSMAYTALYLASDGSPLYLQDTSRDAAAMGRMLAQWSRDKRSTPFVMDEAPHERMARVVPYPVNGSQLYIAVSISMDLLQAWTKDERRALWTAAVLLLVLGALLAAAWIVRNRAARRSARQERKRRTQEQRLGKALGEREILEREVHHRVKNNLQVVGSLLSLQFERVNDPVARQEFLRGKRRIDSMALVHHKLYAQPDLRAIDLQTFLSQVAISMKAMHEPDSRTVSHSVDAGEVKSDADTSIQVGLILCELMTNCYQHAFPYVTGGHIEISVRPDVSDLYRLSVKDNGKGFSRDPARRDQELGLELVEALADQIDGGMEVIGEDGTRVEVTFRMQGHTKVLNV